MVVVSIVSVVTVLVGVLLATWVGVVIGIVQAVGAVYVAVVVL